MGIWIVGPGVQWGGPGCSCKSQTRPLVSGIYGPLQDEITKSEPRRLSPHLPAQQSFWCTKPFLGHSAPLAQPGARHGPSGPPTPAGVTSDSLQRQNVSSNWVQAGCRMSRLDFLPLSFHGTQTVFISLTDAEEEVPRRSMIIEFKELIASSGEVV